MTTITEEQLSELVGAIAAREFSQAGQTYHARLLAWTEELLAADDAKLKSMAEDGIWLSASAMRFRGNWEHDHYKASAAYWVCMQRHIAAGHDKDCRGATIYSKAHDQTMRDAGHGASVVSPGARCTCGKDED